MKINESNILRDPLHEKVSVQPCGSYDRSEVERALETCIMSVGGLSWVSPGMKVALKVNLVSGMHPEKSATTHPVIVQVLAEMLTQRGARVVIGDSPGGTFTREHVSRVYHAAGMDRTVGAGVSLNDDFSVKDAVFQEAASAKTFSYTAWLDDADAIINISKLKTHAMMSMSCSVKNMFGTIPGTTKPEYHMRFPDIDRFADLMVDLNEYFHPVLNIVDAVSGMEGNGPTAGTPKHFGYIAAGPNPYQLDLVCAHIMGLTMQDVPTIRAAYARGLGSEKAKDVILAGCELPAPADNVQLVVQKRSIDFGTRTPAGRLVAAAGRWALGTRPRVNKGECVGCTKCARICPAHAIRMEKKRPVIDRSACIHCFCCQEFCPKGAMKVQRNPVGMVVQKWNSR